MGVSWLIDERRIKRRMRGESKEGDKRLWQTHTTHRRVAGHWQGWARAIPKKGLTGDGIFRGWESQQMTINKVIDEIEMIDRTTQTRIVP